MKLKVCAHPDLISRKCVLLVPLRTPLLCFSSLSRGRVVRICSEIHLIVHGLDLLLLCPSRSMGNLQQALVCFEKRLVIAHELGGEGGGKAQAYWELGTLHSQLGNYEQALSCLEHQLSIARTAEVRCLHLYSVSLSSCRVSCQRIVFSGTACKLCIL